MILALVLSIIGAFIVGFFIGFVMKKANTSVQQELDKAKEELAHYQTTINEHVYKTQEIMENIYQEFSKLQQHAQEYRVKLNLSPVGHKDTHVQNFLSSVDTLKTDNTNDENKSTRHIVPKDYAESKNDK
ncbi:ZapG family protein [Facilibium subflavum]|uniref:ZapG family protein n=1 Tax=Facilibium subflavum TaxID=2219058 RepID=UPI000E64F853|nr:DUF1043 family protein [Facilibium subflavum]